MPIKWDDEQTYNSDEWEDITPAGGMIIQQSSPKSSPSQYDSDEWEDVSPGQVLRKEPEEQGSSLGAFARTITRLPENLAAKVVMAVQGQSGASVADRGIADRFVNWVEDRNRKLAEEYEGTGDFIPGVISKRDVAELGPNLAFSGTSMAGTIAGGLAAAPIPVPGARIAGALSGGAAAAYRMDSYQVMNDWLKKVNQESIDSGLGPISKEEEDKFKKEMSGLVSQHGVWEAGP